MPLHMQYPGLGKHQRDEGNEQIICRHLVDNAGRSGIAGSVFISSMSAREGAPSLYGRDKFLIAGMFFPDLMSGGGGSHSSGMPPMFAD